MIFIAALGKSSETVSIPLSLVSAIAVIRWYASWKRRRIERHEALITALKERFGRDPDSTLFFSGSATLKFWAIWENERVAYLATSGYSPFDKSNVFRAEDIRGWETDVYRYSRGKSLVWSYNVNIATTRPGRALIKVPCRNEAQMYELKEQLHRVFGMADTVEANAKSERA